MSTRPTSAAREIATVSDGRFPPTVATANVAPVLGSVTSRDGTTIGFRRFGSGPALVLLHGSASSGAHHVELARLLSDAFTVVAPDRRGRGLSGLYRTGEELQQELEDVAALLEATGATFLWGLSSGACIALHAARTMPAIVKVGIVSRRRSRQFRTNDAETRGRSGNTVRFRPRAPSRGASPLPQDVADRCC